MNNALTRPGLLCTLIPVLGALLFFTAGCGTTSCGVGDRSACCSRYGDLTGEDLRELDRFRWRNRSRWKLYTGILGMAAGAGSVALGGAYIARSSTKLDAAQAETDPKRRDEMRAESEDQKTTGIVSLSAGGAIFAAGLAFLIVDLVERPDFLDARSPRNGNRKTSMSVRPEVIAGPAGSLAAGATITTRF